LTYQQLAERTHYSTSTLQEAASGRRLPTLPVVQAIAQACAGDVLAWQSYWTQIRRIDDGDPALVSRAAISPPWQQSDPPEAPPHRVRSRRPRTLVAAGALGALLLVSGALLAFRLLPAGTPDASFPPPNQHPAVPLAKNAAPTYQEQEFNPNGAPTFLNVDGSGAGEPIGYGQFVQVSCKIYNVTVPSTKPDGYWYRVAGMPWDNHYYAVANTFGNGDRMGGPYTHNTDWRIPNC
jgi:transcriptional regulator with XRE-family HTH domain